jgi:hypothetical protein
MRSVASVSLGYLTSGSYYYENRVDRFSRFFLVVLTTTMSTSTTGAGLSTSNIDIDKHVEPNNVQFTFASGDNGEEVSANTKTNSHKDELAQPSSTASPSIDLAAALANFRVTPKEVVAGIAPHVFDERRTRSKMRRRSNSMNNRRERSLGRRPSYDFYHSGLAGIHGSAGNGYYSRRSSRSSFDGYTPRPASSPSMKSGASPLRLSAVITVEDIDKLFDYRQDPHALPDPVKDSEAEDSQSIPPPSHALPNRKTRLELKRKMSDHSASSSPSSEDEVRKPRWWLLRIDIRVLKSIGLKIKTARR